MEYLPSPTHRTSQVALVVKNPPANAGDKRCGFDHWVGKIPWWRVWQPSPVFLPGESRGQRSQVGYSPWGHKELDTTERLSTHACTPTHRHTHSKFFPLTFKKSLLKYILRTYCIPKIGITCTFFSLKVSLKKSQPNLCAWCRSICCRTHYK